jgi:hypothetical protein
MSDRFASTAMKKCAALSIAVFVGAVRALFPLRAHAAEPETLLVGRRRRLTPPAVKTPASFSFGPSSGWDYLVLR